MSNLTTRKIVLGMLITLVLAFSVQGTADALSSLTKTINTDVQRILPGASHTFTFSVTNIQMYVADNPGTTDANEYKVGDVITVTAAGGYIISGAGKTYPSLTTSITLKTQAELDTQASISSTEAVLPTSTGLVCRPSGAGELTLTVTHTNGPSPLQAAQTFRAYAVRPDSDVQNLQIAESSSTQSPSFLYTDTNSTMQVVLSGSNSNWAQVVFNTTAGVTLSDDWNNDGTDDITSLTGSLITFSKSNSIATVKIVGRSMTAPVTATIHHTSESYKVIYAFRRITLTGAPSAAVDTGSRTTETAAVNGKIELAVTAKDGAEISVPIEGIEITFDVLGSSGSLKRFEIGTYDRDFETNGKAKTDADGKAKVYLVLGSDPDIYTVRATAPRASNQIEFSVKAGGVTADMNKTAESIEIVSGGGQSASSGRAVTNPLVVVVRGIDDLILEGAKVTFTTSGGTLIGPRTSNPDDPGDTSTDAEDTETTRRVVVKTDSTGQASVRYNVGTDPGGKTVTASILTKDGRTELVIFGINGASSTGGGQQQNQQTATNRITISPLTTTGEPGEEVTIRVTSSPSNVFATLGSNDFGATRFSPQSDFTPFTSTLLLPVEEGTHSFFATGGVLTAGRASVTVEAELGELSITAIGPVAAGVQTFSITARDSDGDSAIGAFTARLSGTGFTSRNVEISGGRGNARVTLPTAASLYTLTVSATGYEDGETPVRIAGTGQQQVADEDEEEVEEEVTVAAEPDSIEITGPSTRSGTVNEALDTPLLVRVLDDDGDGLEGARVFYRVSSGRGRLSARGNGRAIGVVTDDDGYARASFTPLDGGTITVRANTDDLSATVTFTITTGSASSASGARDSGTGGTPGMISPVVHVGAASRPPMLWVDGGAIYALVGASPQRFAPGVDNALNITVGGGKVYWTEKTGESGGTINSANLNGSDVTELTSIKAVPMGIAVDVAGSQLYWTNSRGRIQSADLDGSGITNVMQNLQSPMDLALAGGNAYWTQGNGSVRFVNLRGQKVVRNVSTGTDTPGSLVIGGGKVYWTEKTGESGGTVNSANLNGTGATQLASILAAPMGIAVDGSRSKLYWTNSRGRVQSANLDGSGITNVVSGLGSPGDMVLSNSIAAPAATTTTRTTTTASNKYDVNGDGSVNNADSDAITVAIAAGATDAKYDVNGDGTVNVFDLVEIIANRDPGAAGAPTLFGMKMSAAQIDSLQEQIDLLIAMNDRSPAAMRTLIYLQQLLVTARPEKTQLLANYPNPFNPETWIPYELATDTHVRLTIYNTQGVVIRTLQLGHQSAGYYTGRDRAAYWDGRNALGEQVASGLYFYQLETDEMSLMRKMVILK